MPPKSWPDRRPEPGTPSHRKQPQHDCLLVVAAPVRYPPSAGPYRRKPADLDVPRIVVLAGGWNSPWRVPGPRPRQLGAAQAPERPRRGGPQYANGPKGATSPRPRGSVGCSAAPRAPFGAPYDHCNPRHGGVAGAPSRGFCSSVSWCGSSGQRFQEVMFPRPRTTARK